MAKMELVDTLINVIENDELVYSFDWTRLNEYWDYATEEDVEGISAEFGDGELVLILTTAEGQGGIVAVIDTYNDEIIHVHDGSFAIKVLVTDEQVITLSHVMCFGVHPTYYADCIAKDNMEMIEADSNIQLESDIEFNDEDIRLTLQGSKFTIDDGVNSLEVDLSSIL